MGKWLKGLEQVLCMREHKIWSLAPYGIPSITRSTLSRTMLGVILKHFWVCYLNNHPISTLLACLKLLKSVIPLSHLLLPDSLWLMVEWRTELGKMGGCYQLLGWPLLHAGGWCGLHGNVPRHFLMFCTQGLSDLLSSRVPLVQLKCSVSKIGNLLHISPCGRKLTLCMYICLCDISLQLELSRKT